MSNRRDFLRNAAVFGAASLLGTGIPLVSAAEIKPADPRKKRALRFAHITDCHVIDKPVCVSSMKTVFDQINGLKDKPSFIINSGDTVMDSNNQKKKIWRAVGMFGARLYNIISYHCIAAWVIMMFGTDQRSWMRNTKKTDVMVKPGQLKN